MTKAIREMLERRNSSMAKKVPIIAYYQPDFKRGKLVVYTKANEPGRTHEKPSVVLLCFIC